ncbi:aminoglycoside phosphotransferase [Streptomyces venezuelae]|uniref:Aminoglycoside phosphotransferase n=1 Tax=Streptomyces venezuelae TaxID=54571 RepID=A0A5P2CYE0_STRVZ|nr:phosphotransferase [Streptomyces venezuelae]QES46798.1 aminoglycoside phosphotransferase [Streptomyces venezuelae]
MVSRWRVPYGAELRAELGVPGPARRLGSSPRSRVWRVELARGPVVLKQSVGGADAGQRFAREVAALRLAGRRAPGVVPELLAVDPGARVLVLEHLEHRRPGPDWIVGYAAALARLHAAGRAGDVGVLPRWKGPGEHDVAAFLGLAERLGVPCPAGVPEELAGLVRRLAEAPENALLHGDPCPGNDLHTGDGIRFVDFEQASLGSGLAELAYLRIGFPTCWCVTAAAGPLAARAEEAYRRVWRAETGAGEVDESGTGLADACAGWLVRGDSLVPRARREGPDQLARMVRRDWTWGTATARQRLVHRLGVVAGMTSGSPLLGETSGLCTALRARMLDRWPALPPVPADRPGTS